MISERSQELEKHASTVEPEPATTQVMRRHPRGWRRDDPTQPPWPDGPRRSVDDDFRSVVIETTSILQLFRYRPATAREVILACLIRPRREVDWSSYPYERDDLELESPPTWHPTFYGDGPFLQCLRLNFPEGLELVARLWSSLPSVAPYPNREHSQAPRHSSCAQGSAKMRPTESWRQIDLALSSSMSSESDESTWVTRASTDGPSDLESLRKLSKRLSWLWSSTSTSDWSKTSPSPPTY